MKTYEVSFLWQGVPNTVLIEDWVGDPWLLFDCQMEDLGYDLGDVYDREMVEL